MVKGTLGLNAQRHAGAARAASRSGSPQRFIDVTISTVVFLYDLMFQTNNLVWGETSASIYTFAVALSAAISCAYVFRKKTQILAFLIVIIAASVQSLIGASLSPAAVLGIGLALYALGSWTSLWVTITAFIVAGMWASFAAIPVVQAERARIGEIGMLVLAYLAVALAGRLARNRRERIKNLQEHARQLARERDAQAVIAANEERARIAREIHVIVSHSLGTMVVMADGAAQIARVDADQASHAMERVRDTGRGAMSEMRRMLDVLRDGDAATRAPQPGLGELDKLVEEVRATGLRVDLIVKGVSVDLPSGIDLVAYRIVQEALTNARKHGGSLISLVAVTLCYMPDSLEITIVDDGNGPEGDYLQRTGHGLVGMQERVSAYSGSLDLGPRHNGGFAVRARLPLGGQE